jgi:hypothetical protein
MSRYRASAPGMEIFLTNNNLAGSNDDRVIKSSISFVAPLGGIAVLKVSTCHVAWLRAREKQYAPESALIGLSHSRLQLIFYEFINDDGLVKRSN